MEDYVLKEMTQILKNAIEDEKSSRDRFLRGAEIALTEEIKELFRILAREENRHIEKLNVILKALEEGRLGEIKPDIALRGLSEQN